MTDSSQVNSVSAAVFAAVTAVMIGSTAHAGITDVYWSPTNLAGTIVWMDASDTNSLWADTNGTVRATNAVARWDDKSGNSAHFFQTDAGKMPNGTTSGRTINGLNALDFDGDEMVSSGNPFGSHISDAFLFLVSHKDAGGERWDEYIDIGGNGAWHLELSSWNNPDYRPMFITAGGNNLQVNGYLALVPDAVALKDRVSLFGLYDSVSDDVKQIWIDGAKGSESTSPGVTTTSGDMYLGQLPSVSRDSFDGLFGEVIAIDGTVTEQERETVEGYLAWKWAFVDRLRDDHLYKYAIPGLPMHFSDLAASNITTTTADLYAMSWSNLTSGTVVWDTADRGTTNVSDWAGQASVSGSTPGVVIGTATNLSPDTTYYYRFYGDNGTTNGWSRTPITFATAATAANNPVFTDAASTHNSVTLEWEDNSNTETGFVLQRSTNGTSYAHLTVVDADVTNYVDQAVAVGRTYYYRLAATNSLNGSSTDPTACETNAPETALSGDMIFYENFEEPAIDGEVDAQPPNWIKEPPPAGGDPIGDKAGLSDWDITGRTGDQFALIRRYNYGLTTKTNAGLTNALQPHVNYTLTCDLASSTASSEYLYLELRAGTNVLMVTTNACIAANDFSTQPFSMSYLAFPDNPHIGETIGIRIFLDYQVSSGLRWWCDNLALYATDTSPDTNPPAPNSMVFVELPTSSVSNSITMMATNAVDTNGVQYFFTNTVNGNVSGWQDGQSWTDTGLTPGVTYSYRVKARDKSANTNETNWSSEESAECEPYIILYESFEEPSILQRPATFLDFGTYPLPVGGWTAASSGNAYIVHDADTTYPSTPFGMQYAYLRPDLGYNLTATLDGHVLEADYTYKVTSYVGSDRYGVAQSTRSAYIELIADSTVVASNSVLPTTNDLSETNTVAFTVESTHPSVGGALKIRLYGSPNDNHTKVMFDNIKVYAIPPPPQGSVLIVR